MKQKIFKVTPEPVYVKLNVPENISKKELKDLIQTEVINIDGGQMFRDSVSYGDLDSKEVTLEEAQFNGWFQVEE